MSELTEPPVKRLHVDVQEHVFRLTWRSGATVLVSNDVPLEPQDLPRGGRRYPELARFLDQDRRVNGSHRDSADPVLDQAVLHVRNFAGDGDVVAVLDAARAAARVSRCETSLRFRRQFRGRLKQCGARAGLFTAFHRFPSLSGGANQTA
jgi:hypothetical protein